MRAKTAITRAAAVLGILALGVGTAFIGSRLGTPAESAALPIATESIPVVAPVARGNDPVPEDSDGDDDTFDVSPVTGTAEVPLEDAVTAEVVAAVAALGESDDPTTVYDLPVLGDDGDPCAMADAAESCPDGIRGAIFSLSAISGTGPSFQIYTVLNPPVTAPDRYSVHCPAAEASANTLRLGVGTSAPAASMVLRYHPVGQPDAVRELTGATPAATRAVWAAADPVSPGLRPLVQHCFTLDGLEPGLRYQLTVAAEGDVGAGDTETRYFGLEQDLTRPPVRVVPLLQNIVYTSVPHEVGQSVSVTAVPLDGGIHGGTHGGTHSGTTDCSASDELPSLHPVGEPATSAVGRDHLERNGFLPEFSQRTGQAFYLQEGSSTLLCLFVYDDDRPSWSWETAEYRYSIVVQAPDVTVPTVTLTGIRLHPSFRSDGHISISAQQRGGNSCGGRSFTLSTVEEYYFTSGDFEEVICDVGELSGSAEARSGDVIVRASIGEARNAVLLPLSTVACRGACALPESASYQLLLPTAEVPDGLCGSSFGNCEPPTSAVAAGTATFRVDWAQGNQNGQAEWAIGEQEESAPEAPTSDTPRMNTRAVLEEVSDASGFHLAFDLEVDRDVEFAAVLSGDCILPDTVHEVTGTLTGGSQSVQFDNVCHGSRYTVGVLLFDGETVTPYRVDLPDGYWPGGVISTTPIEKRLNISFGITDPDAERSTTLITPLEVTINGQRANLEIPDWGQCVYGNHHGGAGLMDRMGLAELVTITVSAGMRAGNGAPISDAYPRCSGPATDDGERMAFRTTVPLASITRGGLTIEAPEGSPYRFTMTIRDWPEGS